MTMAAALQRRLTDRITVTGYGTPIYNSKGDRRATGSETVYKARLELVSHQFVNAEGRSIKGAGVCYVGPSVDGDDPYFDGREQVVVTSGPPTFPTGFVLTVLKVDLLTGKDGTTQHLVIHF